MKAQFTQSLNIVFVKIGALRSCLGDSDAEPRF